MENRGQAWGKLPQEVESRVRRLSSRGRQKLRADSRATELAIEVARQVDLLRREMTGLSREEQAEIQARMIEQVKVKAFGVALEPPTPTGAPPDTQASSPAPSAPLPAILEVSKPPAPPPILPVVAPQSSVAAPA